MARVAAGPAWGGAVAVAGCWRGGLLKDQLYVGWRGGGGGGDGDVVTSRQSLAAWLTWWRAMMVVVAVAP